MSALLTSLQARLALGPIPVEELLAVERLAREQGDKDAAKAIAAVVRDCWGTPPELFEALHKEFDFTVDLAAEQWNTKLPRWCGPGGLVASAFHFVLSGETWFCNPPFSQIEQWLHWIWRWYAPEAPTGGAGRAGPGVLLMPATRTEQDWWTRYVEKYRDKPAVWQQIGCEFTCEFLSGRTHYVPPPGVEASSPRFGSCVLKWRPL